MRSWRDDTGERVEEGGDATASRTDPAGTTIEQQADETLTEEQESRRPTEHVIIIGGT